jgi:di/tricarboxylate transporter
VSMEHTGIAGYVAGHLTGWLANTGGYGLLTLFFVLTVLLTQPMSNQAAAIVILPIAMATATQMGLNPRAFAMMIAVAASCSYLTPLEPSCMMVYGPGHYRFIDFLKIGGPLTVLVYLIAILLVPRLWPVALP